MQPVPTRACTLLDCGERSRPSLPILFQVCGHRDRGPSSHHRTGRPALRRDRMPALNRQPVVKGMTTRGMGCVASVPTSGLAALAGAYLIAIDITSAATCGETLFIPSHQPGYQLSLVAIFKPIHGKIRTLIRVLRSQLLGRYPRPQSRLVTRMQAAVPESVRPAGILRRWPAGAACIPATRSWDGQIEMQRGPSHTHRRQIGWHRDSPSSRHADQRDSQSGADERFLRRATRSPRM